MTDDPDATAAGWQRLDKWLWCARFLRARTDCARLAEQGGLRINRLPTDKAHAKLRPGDVLTLPLHGRVLVIEVLALALRRGPAAEAARLYRELPEPGSGVDATLQHHSCGRPGSAAYPAA
jgi:ribosome-associated heat shock protein Hsp15